MTNKISQFQGFFPRVQTLKPRLYKVNLAGSRSYPSHQCLDPSHGGGVVSPPRLLCSSGVEFQLERGEKRWNQTWSFSKLTSALTPDASGEARRSRRSRRRVSWIDLLFSSPPSELHSSWRRRGSLLLFKFPWIHELQLAAPEKKVCVCKIHQSPSNPSSRSLQVFLSFFWLLSLNQTSTTDPSSLVPAFYIRRGSYVLRIASGLIHPVRGAVARSWPRVTAARTGGTKKKGMNPVRLRIRCCDFKLMHFTLIWMRWDFPVRATWPGDRTQVLWGLVDIQRDVIIHSSLVVTDWVWSSRPTDSTLTCRQTPLVWPTICFPSKQFRQNQGIDGGREFRRTFNLRNVFLEKDTAHVVWHRNIVECFIILDSRVQSWE